MHPFYISWKHQESKIVQVFLGVTNNGNNGQKQLNQIYKTKRGICSENFTFVRMLVHEARRVGWGLTYYNPVLLLYSRWKHQKTLEFLIFSGGKEKQHRSVIV